MSGLTTPLGCALSYLRWRQATLAMLALRSAGLVHLSALVILIGLAAACQLAGQLWSMMLAAGP